MGEPYVGEIRMFAGNFNPSGWAFCNGASVAISQNDTLFNLIGTTYGGDGEETFNLPDLQGRIPLHAGQGPGLTQNYLLGAQAGVESVTLTPQQIPVHNHSVLASTDSADNANVGGNIVAAAVQLPWLYGSAADSNFNNNSMTPIGGSQPHDNMMPYLVINFIISLYGVYPTQN